MREMKSRRIEAENKKDRGIITVLKAIKCQKDL
jgi:hypothetical protein